LEFRIVTPSFLLTTEPWIPVWDLDANASRDVGLAEALTRSHRLSLGVTRAEDVAVLRLLTAVFDAACGPRSEGDWDAAWAADALDTDALTAYLQRWSDHLDLFHPKHPAFQCGELTEYARGPEALHPGSLAGDAGSWFHHELLRPLPPWKPARAAMLLLHLLTYDVAGIKRAAPGDPAGSGSKVYGSQIGPVAGSTHLHLTLPGQRLKDVLLLNLPPQPRAPGDAPVWERDTPPAPMRTRAATGRLDMLTWPTRRIRLHATDDATVDAVAHHDGDRLEGHQWPLIQRLDPMTAWGTARTGGPVPQQILDLQHWPQPWRAAVLLDDSSGPVHHCTVVQHAIAAAERGILHPGQSLGAVLSVTSHSNRHKATVSDICVTSMSLGTAGQLADAQARKNLASMARYADALGTNLRKHAVTISRRTSEQVAPRMLLTDLDQAWDDAVRTSAHDPAQARSQWGTALRTTAERKIDEFPLPVHERAKLLAVYTQIPKSSAEPRRQTRAREATPAAGTSAPRRRGPAAATYEVFGSQYTLSQLSQHDRCIVSYKTLRERVAAGWDIEEAATTPGGRGSRPKS
jgi:CRISPR type I-E-associated protein CasA/Cse1